MDAIDSMLLEEFYPLNPSVLTISRDKFGNLGINIEGKDTISNIRAIRTFPYSYKEKFILLNDDEGNEIGIIEDIIELDDRSKEILKEELEKRYYIPVINKVINIEYRRRTPVWFVETNQGEVSFELTRRSDAKFIGDKHLVVKDSNGAKYEIVDYSLLDKRTQDIIDREV